MQRPTLTIFALLLAATSLVTATSHGAEVVIRRQATPQRSLVVLGDIAAVYDINPQREQQLRQVELFPAPPATRVLRLSELQEILSLRGVNLVNCRFAGSSVVTISAPQPVQQASFNQQPEAGRTAKRVAPVQPAAESLPGVAVMATRALRKGEVLRASDVMLARLDKPTNASRTLSDVSQAIGKQVSKSIRSGAAIDQFSLQAPVLIQRRDAVTLWVRSAGVSIRLATRAMGQGAKGDTIVLQSIDGKRKYEATVADYQTAEIIGASLQKQRLQKQRASQNKGL